MRCPYCNTLIYGLTGLREAVKFHRHVNRCKNRPCVITACDGKRLWVRRRWFTFEEALRVRAESGQ